MVVQGTERSAVPLHWEIIALKMRAAILAWDVAERAQESLLDAEMFGVMADARNVVAAFKRREAMR